MSQVGSRPQRVNDLAPSVQVALGGRGEANGYSFACAITTTRQLHCWGERGLGLLGDGQPPVVGGLQRSTPRPVVDQQGVPLGDVSAVSLGYRFGCATNAGAVHCWGENDEGELGEPIQASDTILKWPDADAYYRPFAARVKNVVGANLAVGINYGLSTDGTTLCGWGNQPFTYLGWNKSVDALYQPVCEQRPAIAQVVAGGEGACFLTSSGEVYCGGYFLGLEHMRYQRIALPPVKRLGGGWLHTCAVLVDGRTFCWGDVWLGRIGKESDANGEGTVETTPYELKSLGKDVVDLSTGATAAHTCAVLNDGSVSCWGRNSEGQLGNSDINAPSVAAPVRVKWW